MLLNETVWFEIRCWAISLRPFFLKPYKKETVEGIRFLCLKSLLNKGVVHSRVMRCKGDKITGSLLRNLSKQ